MLSLSKISCPHCGAGLKSSRALPVGKQVTCVRCQAPFTITRADGGVDAAAVATTAPDFLPESCVIPIDDAPALEQAKPRPRNCKLQLGDAPAMPIDAPVSSVVEAPRLGILESNFAQDTPLPSALRTNPAVVMPPSLIPLPAEPVAPSTGNRGAVAVIVGALAVSLIGGIVVLFLSGESPPESDARAGLKPSAPPTATPPAPPSQLVPIEPPVKQAPQRDKPADIKPPDDPPKKETPPEPPPVTPVTVKEDKPAAHPEQKRIDLAIEQGIDYLKTQQSTWLKRNEMHSVGFSALPGLTLLEIGVKKDDPVIQKVADYLRNPKTTENLRKTYDLALAILFLDRLGDKEDSPLIRTLALRLVAGQTPAGGWDYSCPLPSSEQAGELLKFLQETRPQQHLFNPVSKELDQKSKEPVEKPKEPAQDPKKPRSELITEFIRDLAVVQAHTKTKTKGGVRGVQDDNSNTQFAMLALWAARRHDVPTERSLALCEQRFLKWQHANGGWSYRVHMGATPSMTCVGLLGLALGHGASDQGLLAAAHRMKKENLPKVAKEDPAILKGLGALAMHIGTPHTEETTPPMPDLYFLWSVERVAMLYNLPTIGNKDWYSWGVSVLLPNQRSNGSWLSAPYPGHPGVPAIDTCFAMLFLKRSNLVSDLTESLQLYIAIPDPAKPMVI